MYIHCGNTKTSRALYVSLYGPPNSSPYPTIDNRKSRKAIKSSKQAFESHHFGRNFPSFSGFPRRVRRRPSTSASKDLAEGSCALSSCPTPAVSFSSPWHHPTSLRIGAAFTMTAATLQSGISGASMGLQQLLQVWGFKLQVSTL
jgi:hypothetical protein